MFSAGGPRETVPGEQLELVRSAVVATTTIVVASTTWHFLLRKPGET